MTFKQFATGVFYLPATVFSGLTNLFLGSYAKDKRGNYITDDEGNYVKYRGLISLTLDAVKYVGTSIANFISNHKKAIAVAFWASLVVAGAAALTVAFWPAALAAVANFTVLGFSIAALVGTGYAAQVAATAGVAAVVTSAAVYAGAAVINAVKSLVGFCAGLRSKASSNKVDFEPANDDEIEFDVKKNPLSGLNGPKVDSSLARSSSADEEPKHTTSVFAEPKKSVPAPVASEEAKTSISMN
ncbi:hypothetical protein EP47_03765 [Legionella norrlandica]|uniref:Transmembrane protein n=1 Tax=Legionella norrlandica TaxID=1498499 RepID=A0A0A2SX88_9GAMM|nr:hypothetical protein [Legionella norrlandica]KGP64049.1 hypothetical protein EP47_03765 [Legionella norrlandica]